MFEIGAVITTLLCVFLLNRKKTLGWLFGVLGAALFFIVFIQEDLFFQSGLQIVYLGQSIYGWWVWGKDDNIEPKMMNNSDFITHIILATALTLLIVSLFISELGYLNLFLDVLTTLLALLATYYLSKKIIQSWYLWTFINVLMLALFVLQGLWIATGMEIILLTIAVNASISWTKEFKKDIK